MNKIAVIIPKRRKERKCFQPNLVGENINFLFDNQALKSLQEIQDMKPDFKVHL